ncbi:DinB family protein [Angustibacter aerolatus]
MTQFTRADDLAGARFTGVDLRGARFVESDLSGVVMRGVDLEGADLDAPWVGDGSGSLTVNGVDVAPYVTAELERRFPGRGLRQAPDPEGLRAAWAAVQRAWDDALARAAALPPGSVDVQVDGEWSFAQTLRHLVMATDLWLGQAVLHLEHPFHPHGLAFEGAEAEGFDLSAFSTDVPTYDEVLTARADRVALVAGFVAEVTPEQLAVARTNPWRPARPETTRSCLHVILEEEWEHLRFAVRDLAAIEAGRTNGPPPAVESRSSTSG